MSFSSIIVVVTLCLIGASFGATCPTIVTQADVDLSRYTGLWYEIYRIDNIFQSGGKCTNATYTANADGTVGVFNQQIDSKGKYVSIQGSAAIKDRNVPGALKVTFGLFQTGDYNIISTNYDEYAVVYSCSLIPIIKYKIEFAWILSRQKSLSPSTIDKCNKIFADLGVNLANLKPTPQNC